MSLEEFFGVTTRTLQRWQKAGADLEDPVALAAFVNGLSRPSESVSRRLEAGDVAEALRGILGVEAGPPPFAKRVLGEVKAGLTGVFVATNLFAGDAECLEYLGGDALKVRREVGVTGDRELATLLWAVREILREQIACIEDCFESVLETRKGGGE